MYTPQHFAEERQDVLHAAIARTGLATLVTLGTDGLMATHLPLVLDPRAGPLGTLYGHVARGNPQWHDHIESVEALAIFLGPDAYISPSWYATRRQTGKVVPTWNYLSVHVYAPLRTFADRRRLRQHVERLTEREEASREDRWRLTDAPEDYVNGMLEGIVGVELPISRMEGKWKLSQNRPAADRLGAIAGLEMGGGPTERMVAELMRSGRPTSEDHGTPESRRNPLNQA
jgi:transcriptional regulator